MNRTRPTGLSRTDLVGVLGLVALVVLLVLPHLRVRDVMEIEAGVVAELGALSALAREHRDNVVTDLDQDGRGEFPPLADLLGARAQHYKRIGETDTFRHGGYYYAVMLPDLYGRPVRASSPRVGVDNAEVACILVAWPAEPGVSGMRAYCWRPADGILKHAIDGYPYRGPRGPPAPRDTLVEGPSDALRPTRYHGKYWVHPR